MPQAIYESSRLKVKVKSRPNLRLRETFYSLSVLIFHLGEKNYATVEIKTRITVIFHFVSLKSPFRPQR